MQPINSNDQQNNVKPNQKNTDANNPKDENVALAAEQAEVDMTEDTDLNNTPDPAADLDEGELARLDNDNDDNPLI